MKRRILIGMAAILVNSLFTAGIAIAENEGQDDLDKAIQLQLSARSAADLTKVIELCRSASDRGLNKANQTSADYLLTSALFQRATLACAPIFDRQPPHPKWPQLRRIAQADLRSVIERDPKIAEAHYLKARLHSLPGGDHKIAMKSVETAINLSGDDRAARAKGLTLRGNIQQEEEKSLADYNEALKLIPAYVEAIRSRGTLFLNQTKYDKALEDLDKALKLDPEHIGTHEARGLALFLMEKHDDALKSFERALELDPKSTMIYVRRARIFAIRDQTETAINELAKAIKIAPKYVPALLLRSELYIKLKQYPKARFDVEQILRIQPDLVPILQMRANLLAAEDKLDEAIKQLESLQKKLPGNMGIQLQLGRYYNGNDKYQKAINLFNEILVKDEKNWMALRSRADAYLNFGHQAEAIADYEAVLKLKPEDSGTLNNLAWVLATSPNPKIRDGKRSVELANKACRLTDYNQPHILSTLAATYAEIGDFKNAKQWSKKAIKLGNEEVMENLTKELKSYEASKPWRELLTPNEKPEKKPKPQLSPEPPNIIDIPKKKAEVSRKKAPDGAAR